MCSICVCREVCRAVAKALLPLWVLPMLIWVVEGISGVYTMSYILEHLAAQKSTSHWILNRILRNVVCSLQRVAHPSFTSFLLVLLFILIMIWKYYYYSTIVSFSLVKGVQLLQRRHGERKRSTLNPQPWDAKPKPETPKL